MRCRFSLLVLIAAALLSLPSAASAQTGACIGEQVGETYACADGISEAACPVEYREDITCAEVSAEFGGWDGACDDPWPNEEGAPDCVVWADGEETSAAEACVSTGESAGTWREDGTCDAAMMVPALPSSGQGALLALMLLAGLAILAFRSRRSIA